MCAQCANGRRCVSVGGTESILTASVGVMADAHTLASAPHAWTPSASQLTCTSDSFDQKQNNRLNYCIAVCCCVSCGGGTGVRGAFRFRLSFARVVFRSIRRGSFEYRMRVARARARRAAPGARNPPGRELHRSDTVGATNIPPHTGQHPRPWTDTSTSSHILTLTLTQTQTRHDSCKSCRRPSHCGTARKRNLAFPRPFLLGSSPDALIPSVVHVHCLLLGSLMVKVEPMHLHVNLRARRPCSCSCAPHPYTTSRLASPRRLLPPPRPGP